MTYEKLIWLVGYYEGLAFFRLLYEELEDEGRKEMIDFYVEEHRNEVGADRVEMDGEDYRRGYLIGFSEGYIRLIAE